MKFLVFMLFLFFLPHTVYGGEHVYSYEPDRYDLAEAYRGMEEKLSENGEYSEISEFLSSLSLDSPAGLIGELKEKTDISYWVGKIFSGAEEVLDESLAKTAELFALILASVALSYAVSSFSEDTAEGVVEISRLLITVSAYSLVSLSADIAAGFLGKLCYVMNTMTPFLEAVYIAQGSLTEGKVALGSLMLAVTVVGNIGREILLPLVRILFALSAVSAVSPDFRLGTFTSAVIKLLGRCWKTVTIVFSFILSTQSVLAGSADSLGSRTLRFFADSFIPIAGGVISEAFGTVREGIGFLRSAAGIGGIVMILLLLLPGIIPLFMYKLVFSVSSAVSELVGADAGKTLLGDISSLYDFLVAVVLYTAMMFVFALILFARSRGMA